MVDNQERVPPLRALDLAFVKAGGESFVRLRDGLGISSDALVPLPLFTVLQLFDGTRSVEDVQAEIVRHTGQIIPSAQLRGVLEQLDQAFFLDSERFRGRLREVLEDWRKSAVRPAVHAGQGPLYPAEKEELRKALDELYRKEGAADPSKLTSDRPLRAALAPHIDFQRGGHVYTWAYHEVRRRARAAVFVILGTCHQQMGEPFALTRKTFDTPLGPAPADVAFIDRLEKRAGGDLYGDEFHHKNEHSIEFQAVFLRHALDGREFTIVPILCDGFHAEVEARKLPGEDARIGAFLDALASAIQAVRDEEGRDVVLIGGVDLAHVGRHFGDPGRLTQGFLAEVEERDREALAAAAAVDSRAFFEAVARDGNRCRICGVGPIYTMLSVLERLRPSGKTVAGEVLAYHQAVDPESDLCVSFASVAFEEA